MRNAAQEMITLWTSGFHAAMRRAEEIAEEDRVKCNTAYRLLGLVDVAGPGFLAVAGDQSIPVAELRSRLRVVAEDEHRQHQGAETEGALTRLRGRTRLVKRPGTDDYDVASEAFLADIAGPIRDGRVRRPHDGGHIVSTVLQPVTIASQRLTELGFEAGPMRIRARHYVVGEAPRA